MTEIEQAAWNYSWINEADRMSKIALFECRELSWGELLKPIEQAFIAGAKWAESKNKYYDAEIQKETSSD